MQNVSTRGENLTLLPGNDYLVIDALYLDDVTKVTERINPANFFSEVKERVFPFTDAPFARYTAQSSDFRISQIKKAYYENFVLGDVSCFSTDTGLLILIDVAILFDFLNCYTYDELMGESNELPDMQYWRSLAGRNEYGQLGLIFPPGIDSGFDLAGSGLYRITQSVI